MSGEIQIWGQGRTGGVVLFSPPVALKDRCVSAAHTLSGFRPNWSDPTARLRLARRSRKYRTLAASQWTSRASRCWDLRHSDQMMPCAGSRRQPRKIKPLKIKVSAATVFFLLFFSYKALVPIQICFKTNKQTTTTKKHNTQHRKQYKTIPLNKIQTNKDGEDLTSTGKKTDLQVVFLT